MPRRNSPKSDSSDDEEEMRAFAAQFEPQRLAVAAAIIKGGGRGASPERPAPPTPVRPVLRGLPMKAGTPITFTSNSSMTLPSSSPSYSSSPMLPPQKRNHDTFAYTPGSTAPASYPAPKRQAIEGGAPPGPVPASVAASPGPLPGSQGIGGTYVNTSEGNFRDERIDTMKKRIRALIEDNFQLWETNDLLRAELKKERALRLGDGVPK